MSIPTPRSLGAIVGRVVGELVLKMGMLRMPKAGLTCSSF